MFKRIAALTYDAASAMLVACILSCAFSAPAFAYIDPSVMTYTIQAVAGVAVALSTVVGVALRRGRKTLMRVLDIDESAGREVEGDVHRLGADGSPAADGMRVAPDSPTDGGDLRRPSVPGRPGDHRGSRREGGLRGRLGGLRPYRPAWKERLAYGLVVAFFFVFTVYFVAPLEIVSGASSDLVYSMGDVWWVLVGPCLGIVAAIALVLALLRGRAFGIALMAVFAVGLAAYLQALLLNFGLPAADGATIVWGDYLFQQAVSSAVWIALLAGAVVFGLVHARRAQGVAAVLALFLVIVQGVGLASLVVGEALDSTQNTSASGGKVLMTEDQLFTVNPKHNVVVFILDTYDTAYLRRVLDMNPHLLDGLTGFTNYENATSAMIPTRFAIPEMMTGQMPRFDEPFSVYKAQRYARSSFLDDIHDANYSIGLYTDSLRISSLPKDEQASITGKTVNMHDMPNSAMDFGGTLYSLFQMGQYRDVPWPIKWAFWYYTDQINQAMIVADDDAAPEQSIYTIDDVRYYNRLCEFGLTMEEGGYDGAFRFIHLLGSHYPFSYDEDVNDVGEDNSDVFRQSQGAIKIVTTYIEKLKELGVYENTTLIVTADHGYWTIVLEPIEETSTPIMFVKPEQSAEDDAKPIVTDEKPVSHLDLQATVLDAMGLDWSEYANRDEWAGYSMFGDIDPGRVRYYLTTDSEPDLTEVQFREYRIDGNALDWDSWSETGRTIDARK